MRTNLLTSLCKSLFLGSLLIGSFAMADQALDLSPKSRPGDSQYPSVKMKEGFAEKDSRKHVIYMNDEQREQVRLVISGGIVYNHIGQQVPDSLNSEIGHPNRVNYVMDSNGNFYLFNEFATPEIRHSSILAAQPISGGGEITIKSGHIIYIDDRSGHYPTSSLMPNVLKELKSDGVNVDAL